MLYIKTANKETRFHIGVFVENIKAYAMYALQLDIPVNPHFPVLILGTQSHCCSLSLLLPN